MAEPVRARRLTDQEGQRLQQIVRRGKHGTVRMRRAMIIMASASGTLVPAIARLVAADEDTVRDVIHLFNERGLAALDPQWAGFDLTRRQREFKRFARPAFPSPATPGRHGDRSGFFPGLRTRTGRTRARTPGRGQALSTSPELRRRSAWTSPPICAPTHCERPRVAPVVDCYRGASSA